MNRITRKEHGINNWQRSATTLEDGIIKPFTEKPSKQKLYELRVRDKKHHEILFVETAFFTTKDPLTEIRNVARRFNEVVERETGGIEYSVTLRYGITKIAADFYFQYKRFLVYAKDYGLLPTIKEEFVEIDADRLKGAITWKEALGRFSLPKTFFDDTFTLTIPERLLLILYKAYSNVPNREVRDWDHGGITGLSDTRAATMLGCSRKTISTHRRALESKEFISTFFFDGRHRKMLLRV